MGTKRFFGNIFFLNGQTLFSMVINNFRYMFSRKKLKKKKKKKKIVFFQIGLEELFSIYFIKEICVH
jgi:hypothetical protein